MFNFKKLFHENRFIENYDKILKIFRYHFPAFIGWEFIRHELDLVYPGDLWNLVSWGILEASKKDPNDEVYIMKACFRLTPKGFEYLESRETNRSLLRLNNRLLILTILLSILGIGQMIITFWN